MRRATVSEHYRRREKVINRLNPSAIRRLLHLVRITIKQIDDVPVAFQIGFFILMLPKRLSGTNLPNFLNKVRNSPRPPGVNTLSNFERISRLRNPWLWLPPLGSRNTCYVRALTLYRFIDPEDKDVRIHFGVEPGINPADRIHGHAWVTVNGDVLEEPIHLVAGRLQEIYVHPPNRPSGMRKLGRTVVANRRVS